MPDENHLDEENQRLQIALRESEVVRELATLLASSLDLKNILQALVRRTTEVCAIERCAVWLLDEAEGVLKPAAYHLCSPHIQEQRVKASEHVWYHSSLPLNDPTLQKLLQEKGMIAVEDLHSIPGFLSVADNFLVRSVLLVALVRDGRPVGMISLDDPDKIRSFTPTQKHLVQAIGQQAAMAIDNARLYEQAQVERKRAEKLIERARAIYQVAMAVNSGKALPEVLGIAAHHLVSELQAEGAVIALLQEDTLHLGGATKERLHLLEKSITAQLKSLPNFLQATLTGIPLFVLAQKALDAEQLWYQQLAMTNVLIVPLLVGDKPEPDQEAKTIETHQLAHCVGFVLVNYHKARGLPTKGQMAFTQDIAAQCALAIEKANLLASAHKAAALATERANALDAVFQALTEGITFTTNTGEVLIQNTSASQFLGVPLGAKAQLTTFLKNYPTYTLYGQPMPIEDFPLSRALRGERIRAERFITKRSDEEERVVEINVAPVLDSNQKQIGLVSAFRDITEPIRVERRIRMALETMLHVAEAVSGMTDIKSILQRVLEVTLSILNCNRGAVFLYSEEDVLFTPLLASGFLSEAEEDWYAELKQIFTIDSAIIKQNHSLFKHATLIHTDQYPILQKRFGPAGILVAPFTHDDQLLGVMLLDHALQAGSQRHPREFTIWDMAIVEGITQLATLAIVQARWQQEASNARTREAAMREANALKDDFLAITAHEFRSPLTVILAHCQMVLRILRKASKRSGGAQLEEEHINHIKESLSIIEVQTHQLTNIVNTFLEVTQINRGQLKLNLGNVDMAEIVQNVVIDHSATVNEHQVQCVIESAPIPYMVRGDQGRLIQVLTNLVQNAIKYSLPGGLITVSLGLHAGSTETPMLEVRVTDKGVGIPKEAQAHLFERFYRAPNTEGSKTRGIGLGLYIVAELLRLHGGNIRVESSGVIGEGSCFIFTLPIQEDSGDEIKS